MKTTYLSVVGDVWRCGLVSLAWQTPRLNLMFGESFATLWQALTFQISKTPLRSAGSQTDSGEWRCGRFLPSERLRRANVDSSYCCHGSIPIAGGKVQGDRHRLSRSPQYKFPAATEDVAAVYRELLKSYKPGNIGIYGTSMGDPVSGGRSVGFSSTSYLGRRNRFAYRCATKMMLLTRWLVYGERVDGTHSGTRPNL